MFNLILTDWSTMGMRDCRSFATLNLMFGTLQRLDMCNNTLEKKLFSEGACESHLYLSHLSFDASTTTGRNLEHVISDPITGAMSDIARRAIILCR